MKRIQTPALVLALTLAGGAAHAQSYNTWYGTSAGIHATGDYNSGFGFQSLYTDTTGTQNTAVGWDSLIFTTTGSGNTAMGENVMRFNSTGGENVAIGHGAMLHNSTASENTAIGSGALSQNTVASDNTAVGFAALQMSNVTGGSITDNTAVGAYALQACNTGILNTATGEEALYLNTSGTLNVANGMDALGANTTGSWNVAVGGLALSNATTGLGNTAMGNDSGTGISTGSYNTAIGMYATPSGTMSFTGAFGYSAVPTQDGEIRLGDNVHTTKVSAYQPYSNLSDARFKTDVKDDVPGVAFIKKLRPVTFRWDVEKLAEFQGVAQSESAASEAIMKSNGSAVNTGFLAQQVEAAAKEVGYDFSAVSQPTGEKGTYSLSYAEFVVPLVKAVQEQQEEIERLQADLKAAKLQKTATPAWWHAGLGEGPSGLGILGVFVLLALKRSKSGAASA